MIISGEATLPATEGFRAGHVSLHLAIAQESVRYAAASGIRLHTFVVRKLVGSPAGTQSGPPVRPCPCRKPSIAAGVPRSTCMVEAGAGLVRQQQPVSGSRAGHRRSIDPTVVVAFVDDQTREVLRRSW
jgi:hypothetical protein